jgi:exonuclease SbcC
MDATSANVARVRGDLAAIDDAIAVSDRECAVLRGAIDAEVDARLAACRANVERLSTEAAQAARATATAAGAVANAARAIDDVGAMRKRLASERAEIQTRAKHLAHIEVAVAACKDAPQLLIESIVPSIEMKANELLSRVSNTSMQVQLRTQAELKSREAMAETLDVIVVDEIGERPYEMYSGGERFRIDFALRVALSWALSIRAGAPLEMLVIDEGFGTQDAAGKQAFAECLNSVNDLFEKVIVISHVPEMESAFPARFRVTKGPSGSTIAREV